MENIKLNLREKGYGNMEWIFTLVPCILILWKFYLFTNWYTSEFVLKNNIKIYINVNFNVNFNIVFKTTH